MSLDALKEFRNKLNEVFGKETSITESHGKKHDYLGMTVNYASPGKVEISMMNYLKLVLQDVPEDMQGGVVATPAGNHLFLINDKYPVLLDGKRQDSFVHIVMQLLYLSQRARLDIRTAVSFLCQCLSSPDVDNYKKSH